MPNDHQEEGGTVTSCTNHMNSDLHTHTAATFEPKKRPRSGRKGTSPALVEHLFPDRKGPPAPASASVPPRVRDVIRSDKTVRSNWQSTTTIAAANPRARVQRTYGPTYPRAVLSYSAMCLGSPLSRAVAFVTAGSRHGRARAPTRGEFRAVPTREWAREGGSRPCARRARVRHVEGKICPLHVARAVSVARGSLNSSGRGLAPGTDTAA